MRWLPRHRPGSGSSWRRGTSPPGATLQPRDVRVVSRPAGVDPAGRPAHREPGDRDARWSRPYAGERCSPTSAWSGRRPCAGSAPGLVAAPVRVADAEAVALLAAGDHVDVLAATVDGGTEARLVAAGVRVLTVPRPASTGFGAGTR